MNRLPTEVDVIWLQSRPEIRFKMPELNRGDVVFRADTPDELLGKIANAYAHALVTIETLKADNKKLRGGTTPCK